MSPNLRKGPEQPKYYPSLVGVVPPRAEEALRKAFEYIYRLQGDLDSVNAIAAQALSQSQPNVIRQELQVGGSAPINVTYLLGTETLLNAADGAIVYVLGKKLMGNTPGTIGQALISGGSGAPTWQDVETVAPADIMTLDGTGTITGNRLITGTFTYQAQYWTHQWASNTPANCPLYYFKRAEGTMASKVAVASGDILGAFGVNGWDGSAWANGGVLQFKCTAAVAAGKVPTSFQLYLMDSAGGLYEVFSVSEAGLATAHYDLQVDDDLEVIDDLKVGHQAYYSAEFDNGNSGAADTVTWTNGPKQKSTLTGDCVFTFVDPSGPCNLILRLVGDGTARTPTWPAAVKWKGSTGPGACTGTAGHWDLVMFYFDGTNYSGDYLKNFG